MISLPNVPAILPSPLKKRGYSQFECSGSSFFVPEELKNIFQTTHTDIPEDLIKRLFAIYNFCEVFDQDPIERLWIAGKAIFKRCHLHFILWRALFLGTKTDEEAFETYKRFPFKEALYDLAHQTLDRQVFIKSLKVLLHFRENDFRNRVIVTDSIIRKSRDIEPFLLLQFFSVKPLFTEFSPNFQTLVFEHVYPKSDQQLADLTHEIDEIGHPSLYAQIDEEWCQRLRGKVMPLESFASLPSHILPKLTLYVVTHSRDSISSKTTEITTLSLDCRTEDRDKMFPHLQRVYLFNLSNEQERVYQGISAMTSLTSLDMDQIPGQKLVPFSALTDLRQIALRGSLSVEDSQVVRLALPRLQKIELSRFYKISEAGISHLRLENLTELSLTFCPLITDQFNNLFSRLIHLKLLNLSSCSLSDEGVKDLPKAKELESVSLEDTKITDAAAPLFALLNHLTYLNIANINGFTGAALEHLKKCQKLRVLKVSSGSDLADKAEQELQDLPYFSEVVKSARRRLLFQD